MSCCTGINNFPGFHSLCAAVKHYFEVRMGREDLYDLDAEGRVLLTLMKLKLNCSFIFLSLIMDVSEHTCSRYFHETIKILRKVLENFIYWPTKDSIRQNIPKCFAEYPRTRVILDCTELPVYSPACILCRTQTYSFYYCRHTLKILLGVTPDGVISLVSDVFGGKASDSFMFEKSNVVKKCEQGDAIMVDKDFRGRVDELCADNFIQLVRPPFKWKEEPQLSAEDCECNVAIARARVHVERVNERIKNFNILRDEITWNMLPYMNDIIVTICALVNLSPPILADDKF